MPIKLIPYYGKFFAATIAGKNVTILITGRNEKGRKLSHNCIHKFLDCYDNSKHMFFTFEYFDHTLISFKKRLGIMRNRSIEKMIKSICAALIFIHGRNYVHCDISADNIIIIFADNKLNFKLSSIHKICAKNTPVTAEPHFPPEIHRGNVFGEKSDIWMFGAALYFYFTGGEIIGKNTEISSNEIYEPMNYFVEKMIADDPIERYSPEDILQLLQSKRKRE